MIWTNILNEKMPSMPCCSHWLAQAIKSRAIYAVRDVPTASVVPRAEWISADNPPKTYRDEYGELIPFLVCCQGTVYPFRAMYDGKNWGDGIGRLNVTHWMPLPEPPKGG